MKRRPNVIGTEGKENIEEKEKTEGSGITTVMTVEGTGDIDMIDPHPSGIITTVRSPRGIPAEEKKRRKMSLRAV